MTTQLTIPTAFAPRAPAQRHAALNDKLSDGIGASYGIVHYKGKVWSITHKGQNYPILRPDDGTPSGYLDVVILSANGYKSKSFYPTYDPNNSAGKRPICSSQRGDVPDAGVQQAQASACAVCPRNELKVNPENGKKFRECTDYKRLAVYLMPDVTQRAMGVAHLEPMFLRVPGGSLQGLQTMGDQMEQLGYHYSEFVTRITFDPTEGHPKMIFTPVGQPLVGASLDHILALRAEPLVERILGESEAAPPQQAALPPPNVVNFPPKQITAPTNPVVNLPPPVVTLPSPVQPTSIVMPPAPPPSVLPAAQPTPTGFVGQIVQTVQGTEDTGQPTVVAEDSSPDLDDYVASLVKTSL